MRLKRWRWAVDVFDEGTRIEIRTFNLQRVFPLFIFDQGIEGVGEFITFSGTNLQQPGGWVIVSAVADTGSTLSLMTLTLMTLGVAARQFKRAPA